MSRTNFAVVAALLALIAGLLAVPIIAPERTSPQWEYEVSAIPDEKFTLEMNAYGKAGWELVFARRAVGGMGDDRTAAYEVIFKRPK